MPLANREFRLPQILVEAESRYLLGFPLLMAVTFDNTSSTTEFVSLPELDLFFSRGPLSIRLEPIADGVLLTTVPSELELPTNEMGLKPGEQKRMLFDLSNLVMSLQPGQYRLTLTLHVAGYTQASEPIVVEFVTPSTFDAMEATRLRRLGQSPTDTGAWAPFLRRNWNTVTVSGALTAAATQQLALHLFLHRAFYGPQGVAELETAPLKRMTGPVLAAEAAVLEFEILHARRDAVNRDKLYQSILKNWPGLRYRLEKILRGEGLLTSGRKWFGPEQEFIKPPASYPYTNIR